jgi:hypothetical protein
MPTEVGELHGITTLYARATRIPLPPARPTAAARTLTDPLSFNRPFPARARARLSQGGSTPTTS